MRVRSSFSSPSFAIVRQSTGQMSTHASHSMQSLSLNTVCTSQLRHRCVSAYGDSRGINPEQFCEYVEYITDRRLERIGLGKQYGTANPFPWMSQSTDLAKEKNFFETRVTEYQVGAALEWD